MAEKKYIELSKTVEKYILDNKISGRLPGIYKLAAELQVNHITLRKAIRILAEQKKVQIRPHDGTYTLQNHAAREKFYVLGFAGFSYKGETVEKMFDSLNRSLRPTGYQAMNIAYNALLFDENPKLILKLPIDAFAMFAAITRKTADVLLEAKFPAICTVNSLFPEFNHIGMDHVEAYTQAVKKAKMKGCRKIAFFGYERRKDFKNYLEDIHQVFVSELGKDFNEKFFRIYNSVQFYKDFGEKYHEVMVNDAINTWKTDLPDAIITLHSAVPFFRRLAPSMLIIEFAPNFMPETLADVSFYEDNASMLSIASRRMLEILNGDTSITEIKIPFIQVDRANTDNNKHKEVFS